MHRREARRVGSARRGVAAGLAVGVALLLGVGCGGTVQNAPLPQGKDWWFVGPGFKRITVTVTQSTSQQGNYRVTTTTTTSATGFTGIQVPERSRSPIPTSPGNPDLLRDHPDLAGRPFKPLEEAP